MACRLILVLLTSACAGPPVPRVPLPENCSATAIYAVAEHFAVKAVAPDAIWISSFRSRDLSCRWTRRYAKQAFQDMVMCPSGLVCLSSDSIRSIDWEVGTTRWVLPGRGKNRLLPRLSATGDSLILSNTQPMLVDTRSGRIIWQVADELSIRGEITFGGGNFFFPTWEGRVEARALADGSLVWASQPSEFALDDGIGFGATYLTVGQRLIVHSADRIRDAGSYQSAALFPETALIAYRNDTLMRIAADGSPMWATPIRLSEGCIYSKVEAGRLFLVSDDWLYLFRLQDGKLEAQQVAKGLQLHRTLFYGSHYVTISQSGELLSHALNLPPEAR